MARWEPGTRERLQAAALELYVTKGFEQTTVEEIARAVGLTERTFFRHFADKREVLFDPQHGLQQGFLDAVAAAPADATPLETVASALATAAGFFDDERRSWSRRRQSVIAANPALQERELLKMAALETSVAQALRARGVEERAAALAAGACITVFGVAFLQWIADGEERSLADIQREVMGELGSVAAGLADVVAAQRG
ncbi:TetR/AcrR family transcriptional regulator [Pseudonocardia sp. CA-107938]|uniref:TetR/AcrR family transcriptional regulator n=1 Tax=Pseudonocardia sp. CA-107938 TaxID=3240021 RepID=UPI003D8D3E93